LTSALAGRAVSRLPERIGGFSKAYRADLARLLVDPSCRDGQRYLDEAVKAKLRKVAGIAAKPKK